MCVLNGHTSCIVCATLACCAAVALLLLFYLVAADLAACAALRECYVCFMKAHTIPLQCAQGRVAAGDGEGHEDRADP
jgi:hypothetical protein